MVDYTSGMKTLKRIWPEAAWGVWQVLQRTDSEKAQKWLARPEGTEEIAWSEYQAYRAHTTSGRATCYACGERLPADTQVIKIYDQSRSGGRYDENQRLMHIAPCIEPLENQA
jgi:hypothetical protein